MGSFSFGEILTILVIILIVFGPNRLPEFARKVGELIAWSRKSIREFTESVEGELGDGMQPLSDLKREFDGARNDLTGAINTIGTGSTSSTRKPPTDDDADTEAPATEAPATETPATEAPATEAPATKPADTGQADSATASADASEPSTPSAGTTESTANGGPDVPMPKDHPDSNGSESDDNA
jgi:TatA/E family protein of Tat protein translocase